jgi:hypothetical protein
MQPNSIKNLSSLHIYGVNDVMVDNDRTLKLAAVFENPLIASHPGGHFTPNTWPNVTIKQFLIEQQMRNTTAHVDIPQFQSFKSFEEKLEATISHHQKRKIIPVIPIGLSKPIEDQNIDNYLLDDIMLLIWCKRTTFHNHELTSSFFRDWILLYLKQPDEILSMYLNFIPKYGSWGDLKTLYLSVNEVEIEIPSEKPLLDKLKSACVKMFGDQLKHDHRIILNQSDESANEQEEQMAIKDQEWISNCAKEAPRISNNRNNPGTSKYFTPFISSIRGRNGEDFLLPASPRPDSSPRFGLCPLYKLLF